MFRHLVELFCAPWQVPFLTLSVHMGPSSLSLSLGSPSAKALSHLSSGDKTTPLRLRPHSCCIFCFQHVFLGLTTNPPYMCITIIRHHWSDSSGKSQQCCYVFSIVIPSGLLNLRSLCLLLFACFALTVKSPIWRKGLLKLSQAKS